MVDTESILTAAAAARYLRCGKQAVYVWARRGCKFPGGAVVRLACEMAGSRFKFTRAALDAFKVECERAMRGEPVAPPPPDPDLARRLAGKARVAAKLRGPVRAGRL